MSERKLSRDYAVVITRFIIVVDLNVPFFPGHQRKYSSPSPTLPYLIGGNKSNDRLCINIRLKYERHKHGYTFISNKE